MINKIGGGKKGENGHSVHTDDSRMKCCLDIKVVTKNLPWSIVEENHNVAIATIAFS